MLYRAAFCVLLGGLGLVGSSIVTGPDPQAAQPTATSASGDLIAFYSERDGNAEIYTMNADGSNQRRLTSRPSDEQAPNWSPDGRQIIYSSDQGGRWQAWVMNADGSNQHALTSTPWKELPSDWSPDGNLVAFMSSRNDPNPTGCYPWCNWQLYVMRTDGSEQRRLLVSTGSDEWPRWSPDGRRLVFFSRRAGNWDIYVVNADGTGERRLTTTPAWEALPVWSPDGSQIVFCTMAASTMNNRGISIMNADGTGMRVLIAGSSRVNEDPVFSPDGRQIAFQSDRTGRYQIFVMNADGSDQRNISQNHANEYWPNWRPASRPTPPPTEGHRIRLRLSRVGVAF